MTPLVNWRIDYECDVTCRQKLYEDPKGYKFIYRPIQLGAVNDIANLKNFTDYTDFRTMKKDGTSTSNYVSKARQSNVTYNQLGVCTKECW